MDRLDELALFVKIVEEGSLVGASRKLRRSAPAVTRTLAVLEDRIGVRLIDRTTRRLAPTEAGRQLLERARLVLGEYEASMAGLVNAPVRGVLRVTAPVQFGRRYVAPIVTRFLDRFADVEVELLLSDRNLDLIDEAVNVALRIGHLPDSPLIARQVGEVRRLWVASHGYLKKRGTPGTPAELAAHDVILGTTHTAEGWRFAGWGSGTLRRLKGRLRVNDVETRLRMARAGRGIAQLLSYQVAEDLAAGSLVRLFRRYEPPPLPVHLLTKDRTHRAPKIGAFVEFAANRLLALPAIRPENAAS